MAETARFQSAKLVLYRPSPRWHVWAALGGAVLIHLTAVAVGQRREPPPMDLSQIPVASVEDAKRAADVFLGWGVGNVVITLGAQGALVKNGTVCEVVSAFNAGEVVETTGAGDAFAGGFAVALAEKKGIIEAVRFGCAVAGISVTRPGTAPSMPRREEVDALLRRG